MSVEEDQNNSNEIEQLVNEYSNIFDRIGQFTCEYYFILHLDAEPVVHPHRRVPMALREKVQQELDRMVEVKIIAKVTKPTDWVNRKVLVEKKRNGNLRICLDPRDLNKAIKRPYYQVPPLDNVTGKLSNARHFSTLDARSGYWEIKIHDESSCLTTFKSPFGIFMYLLMPFGINSNATLTKHMKMYPVSQVSVMMYSELVTRLRNTYKVYVPHFTMQGHMASDTT